MKLIIEINNLDSMQTIKNNNSIEEKKKSTEKMVKDLDKMFLNVKKTLNYKSYSNNDKIDIWIEEKGICGYLIKGIDK
jgi:phosphate uptake regulator